MGKHWAGDLVADSASPLIWRMSTTVPPGCQVPRGTTRPCPPRAHASGTTTLPDQTVTKMWERTHNKQQGPDTRREHTRAPRTSHDSCWYLPAELEPICWSHQDNFENHTGSSTPSFLENDLLIYFNGLKEKRVFFLGGVVRKALKKIFKKWNKKAGQKQVPSLNS